MFEPQENNWMCERFYNHIHLINNPTADWIFGHTLY